MLMLPVATLVATCAAAQQVTLDPYPAPIETTQGVIAVNYREFATIPDVNGEAPRLMHFVDEPQTKRMFVSVMTGALYSLSYDGKTVTLYVDLNAAPWGVSVQSQGAERGVQSFAFHPQFNRQGTPGYGKFYTYLDTSNMTPSPDFTTPGKRSHDTVLLEWTAKTPSATTYDGGPPRELFRAAHPFGNHNGGQIGFNPLAKEGTPEYGLLYVGFADGGNGGDPMDLAQNMSSPFGKILRIDPLGKNSANGKYGIPDSNPFVKGAQPDTVKEIYALGVRNPQRFSWDTKTGALYLADIGQNAVEEISPVTAGANLGWNKWEASFPYVKAQGQVDSSRQRDEAGMTWPVVEFDHRDPLFQRAAITGVIIYRQTAIPALAHLMIFGDNPSGQIFYVDADKLPNGGQAAVRQILFNDNGSRKTLLQLIQEKNKQQGKEPAARADLRFGEGAQGQVFILNKRDGVIRVLVP
jgi:hypothetical protein